MMSQKPVFGFKEQKIVEAELEQNSKGKGDLIASVKDVVISQVKNLPPVENPSLTTERANHLPNESQPQRLINLLIGSPEVVTSTIHHLRLIGYADACDWSTLEPNPDNQAEVISILVRYIRVQ